MSGTTSLWFITEAGAPDDNLFLVPIHDKGGRVAADFGTLPDLA